MPNRKRHRWVTGKDHEPWICRKCGLGQATRLVATRTGMQIQKVVLLKGAPAAYLLGRGITMPKCGEPFGAWLSRMNVDVRARGEIAR